MPSPELARGSCIWLTRALLGVAFLILNAEDKRVHAGTVADPVIIAQPQSAGAYAGEQAQFTITAEGTPPIRYAWRRDTNYISGATNSVLILSNVQVAQSGTYYAVVSSPNGSVTSAPARLTVIGPFEVINTADTGFGSLRAAVQHAYRNLLPATINLSNLTGTIALEAPIQCNGNVSLLGPGARRLTLICQRALHFPAIQNSATAVCSVQGLKFYGGGIWNFGVLHLKECEIENAAGQDLRPNAVYNEGQLFIEGSCFLRNTVRSACIYWPQFACDSAGGGALFNAAQGFVGITNSTFAENRAESACQGCDGYGGAVARGGIGEVHMVNCTFVDNYAANYPSLGGADTLVNTIFVESGRSGVLISGNNLYAGTAMLAGLGPLSYPAAAAQFFPLLKDSPAIEAGRSSGSPRTDQLGTIRPQGMLPDIGAVEFLWPSNSFGLVPSTNGPGLVVRQPDLSIIPAGTVVTLTAIPAEDYSFTRWSGDVSGSDNPLVIRVDRNLSVTASFVFLPTTATNSPGSTVYVWNTNSWGPGSLRQAIRDVNASGGGIILPRNISGAIPLELGLPAITYNTVIGGPTTEWLVIDAQKRFAGLRFAPGTTSHVFRVKLRNATSTNAPGGGIFNGGVLTLDHTTIEGCWSQFDGGGLCNTGSATLLSCTISNCSAAAGGGIYNAGRLFVRDSEFRNCKSQSTNSDAVYRGGGGIHCATGVAAIVNCSLRGNAAFGLHFGDSAGGGGIFLENGFLSISGSSICSNYAIGIDGSSSFYEAGPGGHAQGAGLMQESGMLTLSNSSVFGNTGRGGHAGSGMRFGARGGIGLGGGICLDGGTAEIANCTLSGNQAFGGESSGGSFTGPGGAAHAFGGGLVVRGAHVQVKHCTISSNQAFGGNQQGQPGAGEGGGICLFYAGELSLFSTVVAGNKGATNGIILPNDIDGAFTSLGYNLVGQSSGLSGLAGSDLRDIDPRLGALADNGGPTLTHSLLSASPAIDAGLGSGLALDQRGFSRRFDNPLVSNAAGSDGTDIGAFEFDPRPRLLGVSHADSETLVRFTAVPGVTYRLLWTSNVAGAAWQTVPDTIEATNGVALFRDVVPARYRFYRILASGP